jgi:hypothetical protein
MLNKLSMSPTSFNDSGNSLVESIADFYALMYIINNGFPTNWKYEDRILLKGKYFEVKKSLRQDFIEILANRITAQVIKLFEFKNHFSFTESWKPEKYNSIYDGAINSVENYTLSMDFIGSNTEKILDLFEESRFGSVWIKIFEAYDNLKENGSDYAIDSIIHLQHNFGSIFDVVFGNISQLTSVLDIKSNLIDVKDLEDYVSGYLKPFLAKYSEDSKLHGTSKSKKMKKHAINMRTDRDKEQVLRLDAPITEKDPESMFKSMGTDVNKIGKYILDKYTHTEFFIPLVEFEIDKKNRGKVVEMLSLPYDSQTLGASDMEQFDNSVGMDLKTLGNTLSSKLYEKFPMLKDVSLHFGWNTDGIFTLYGVKFEKT